jgi:hypothetical protein
LEILKAIQYCPTRTLRFACISVIGARDHFLNSCVGAFCFCNHLWNRKWDMTILRATAIPEMLTLRNYGSINSLISVPSTICKALGPFALAFVFQRFGSYDPAIMGILVVTVCMLISYWYATSKCRMTTHESISETIAST